MLYSKVQFKSIKLHVLDVKVGFSGCVCVCGYVFVLLYSLYVKKAMMRFAQDKFPHGDNKVEL